MLYQLYFAYYLSRFDNEGMYHGPFARILGPGLLQDHCQHE